MKRIILLFALFISLKGLAQFPNTDSLRAYNNRYIGNSPISAFSALRLNTLLYGIINNIDSAKLGTSGSVGVDTLYALNDSTIRYKKNGVWNNQVIPPSVYSINDTTLYVRGDTITVGGTGSGVDTLPLSERLTALETRVDTTNGSTALDEELFAGEGTPGNPFAPKNFTVGTIAELKAYDGTFKYYARVEGQNSVGDRGARNFYWDASSTATADDITVVQVTGVETGRWIAVLPEGEYPASWWGLSGDIGAKINTIIDAVPSYSTIKLPKGTYELTTEITVNKPVTINFNNSTIERDGTTGNFISVQSSNVSLYNLYMNGQYTDTVYTGGQLNNFIETDGATNASPYKNLHFENIHVKTYKNSGFWLKYVDGFKIINCSVDSVPYAGFMLLSAKNGELNGVKGKNYRGVFVVNDGTGDTAINAYGVAFSKSSMSDFNSSNNVLRNFEFRDNRWWEMIDTHGADDLTIESGKIYDAYKGVAMVYYYSGGIYDAPKNITINDVRVDNSNITDADAGIQIQGATGNDFSTGIISNCILTGSGVAIANTKGFIVSNVTVNHPSLGFGVLMKNDNMAFQVTNVTVYDVWNSDGTGNNAAFKTYTGNNVGYISGLKLRRGDFTPPSSYGTYLNWYGIRPNNELKSNRIVIGPGCDFKDAQNQYGNTYALVFDQSTNLNRKRYTSSFTVLVDDQEIGYEHATGSLHTATLPALDSTYHRRRFRITNTSPGTLALSIPYYETYGGTAKTTIAARTSVEFYSDSAYNIYFGRPTPMEPGAGGSADTSLLMTKDYDKQRLDSLVDATAIEFSPDFVEGASGVELAENQNGAEDKAMVFNPGSSRFEATKVYTKSLLDLLYVTDTLGVKVVRSFHEGYNTGGFSVRYVPGGTPDYVTSWPSKVYTGTWKRIDYTNEMVIEQLGALGSRNAGVTAATLGYDATELSDLYGTYFTKATTDRIDNIAMNQMIKSIGVGYFNHSLSSTRYYMNAKLVEFPYFTSNQYQVIKITGNNSWILNEGTRRTMFWRYPTSYDSANILVQTRYIISGITFSMADSAISIHPSYQSEINNCKFVNSNYGVVLRWDMHASINHCGFEAVDSAGVWVGRFEGISGGLDPQSNYFLMRDNKFTSSTNTKYNIYIFNSNGATIEHTIFEGTTPQYNIYADFTGGNNREMRVYSTHLENIPDSAHFYFRGRGGSIYFDKIYAQTNAVLVDAGSSDGTEGANISNVYLNNIPYWGGVPSFKTSGAKWFITNSAFIDLKSSANWVDGTLPSYYSGDFATGIYSDLGSTINTGNKYESYGTKIYDGVSLFNSALRVPRETDGTEKTAAAGQIYYHNTRSKFYGGVGTSWSHILDSIQFLNRSLSATANSQTLTAISYSPTFSTGAFTGTSYRFANHASSVGGQTIEYRLSNTSGTASSQTKLTLHAGVASGTAGAGLTEIYNSGLFSSAITDITLRTSTAGKNIYFQPSGTTTKGTFSSTGLRIGDATAPIVAFEIGSTGSMLLPKGTTAQRPTGVAGYLRVNTDSTSAPEFYDGTNWNRIAKAQALRDTAAQLRAATTAKQDALVSGTNIKTINGTSVLGSGDIVVSSTTRSLVKVSDADYTISSGSGDITVVYWGTITAGRTVTLPSAATNTGRRITIRHVASGAFDITTSASLYENSSTWVTTVTGGTGVSIESDGTNWIIVAK